MTAASGVVVRPATTADAEACAAVYAPYVHETAASFETEPPGAAEMARRISGAQQGHAWLVAEQDGGLLGYAYATTFRSRPAYRWTCETSVYLTRQAQGRGVGRALYEALLARLAERGFRTTVAVMTVPNPASAALHASLGFRSVGVLTAVGWKAGRWHDVELLERRLGGSPDDGHDADDEQDDPPEPS